MASTTGQTPDALIGRFRSEPHAYEFFRALRWLQAASNALPRIGDSLSPAEDPARFGQIPYLRFAPSTLQPPPSKERGPANRIYSHHFGVFGPNGPLPLHITEYARNRMLHHGDLSIPAFCDIFHHRLISFFFRAWAQARKEVDYDRPETPTRPRRSWPVYIGSLFGFGTDLMQRRDQVPDDAKLFYSGRLAAQPRNAEGLETILSHYFGAKTELDTFVGRWIAVPPESQLKLGADRASGELGRSTIVGAKVWDCQLSFRIRFGPLSLHDYQRLLPTGTAFARLRDWVRLYTTDQYLWDVQLVLRRDQVPGVQLGGSGRLGWDTWLKTAPFERDPADLVFEGCPEIQST